MKNCYLKFVQEDFEDYPISEARKNGKYSITLNTQSPRSLMNNANRPVDKRKGCSHFSDVIEVWS